MLPPDELGALGNVEYNRSVWDWYADKWSDLDFRRQQLANEGRSDEDPATVARLGEEWGRLDDAREVIETWVLAHVNPSSVVGEIGTGGGRIARMVAPQVAAFHAFDISAKMIDRVRVELSDVPGVAFHLLDGPRLPSTLAGQLDFLYAFDVFVHIDLHVQWRYLQEVFRILKPGGMAFLHTANLSAPAGWDRFAAQDGYRVEGFYFMTPEAVRILIAHAGLALIEEGGGVPSNNFYLARDYVVLVRKPRVVSATGATPGG